MSNPYKVGDVLVCMLGNNMPSDCYNSQVNRFEHYTVTSISGNYIVRLKDVIGCFSTSRFELIARA